MTPPTRSAPRRSAQTKPRSKESSSENLNGNDKSTSSRSHAPGGLKSTDVVTGIRYPSHSGSPSPHDSGIITAVDARRSSSNTYADASSRSGGGGGMPDHADVTELDALWDSIRQKKEKRLAKEKPKVQSLEQVADELASMHVPQPQYYHHQPSIIEEEEGGLMQPEPIPEERIPKRRKSISSCRVSTDGKSIVMVFDMNGVCKEDIHVGFQKSRLMLTWATAELSEWEEDGIMMRERSERIYHRTIPLADGTRFEEVHGQMHGSKLVLRFPNMKCIRVEAQSLKSN